VAGNFRKAFSRLKWTPDRVRGNGGVENGIEWPFCYFRSSDKRLTPEIQRVPRRRLVKSPPAPLFQRGEGFGVSFSKGGGFWGFFFKGGRVLGFLFQRGGGVGVSFSKGGGFLGFFFLRGGRVLGFHLGKERRGRGGSARSLPVTVLLTLGCGREHRGKV
jgi:hypothetical protein